MKNIEKNLYESLIFDEVEFTIYDNFPFASVKINNLLLKESQNFDNDTLLYTERAYVELSLIDIFNKNYDIKNIIVTDATVNFKYNDLNESNFQLKCILHFIDFFISMAGFNFHISTPCIKLADFYKLFDLIRK